MPDGYIVHEYDVLIEDENEKKVYDNNFVAAYHIIDKENAESFTVGRDILEAGKAYTLTIKAESAYHFYSELVKVTFIVPENK